MRIFKKLRKSTAAIMVAVMLFAIAAAGLCAMFYYGIIHINNPRSDGYSVIGVDVSAYQGKIDWQTLANQGISFAFIKATEGSSFVDSRFSDNFSAAGKTDLRIGAYHFFSFESSGKTQAQHFCATVPKIPGGLPPVVDVEYYGKFDSSNISADKIRRQLREYVDEVKIHYGTAPIIYATNASHKDIIGNEFSDCYLWIRDVYGKPDGNIQWTFWQYSNRHVLKGYEGAERYIDMNTFCGSAEEFAEFGKISSDN